MLQQLTLHPCRSLSAVNIMATLKKTKKNDSPASEEEEDRSVQPDWAELSSANLRHCDFREFTDSYLSSILASSLPALGQQTVKKKKRVGRQMYSKTNQVPQNKLTVSAWVRD